MRSSVTLGIDISDNIINMALLRQSTKGIELLKAVNGPIPEGVINNGVIEDPVTLTKAIRDLKSHNKIRAKKAAISLSVEPQIVRIIETPKGSPRNIGQFIRNELKSYVVLSGKNIAFDFCGIKQGQGSGERLLAVACDALETSELAQTCGRAGLNVEVIEPALLSYIRVLYSQKIEGRFNSNVILVILNNSNATMCVFKKEFLDFIKIENIQNVISKPNEICKWTTSHINEIMRFYDMDVTEDSVEWEITIVKDGVKLPDDAERDLRADIKNDTLEIIDTEKACSNIFIKKDDSQTTSPLVPIGLALKLLDINESGLRINLVPPESSEVKYLKKQLVTTGVILALVSIILIAAGTGLSFMADKITEKTKKKKKQELSKDTYTLLNEQESLIRQIRMLSDRPIQINKILDSHPSIDWPNILTDIKKRTPKTVRILKLYDNNNSGIRLEGHALSYESVRLFVDLLNESEFISTASLTETIKNEHTDGFVLYLINCSLVVK